MQKNVTTTYLEIKNRDAFRPKNLDNPQLSVQQAGIPSPALNHFFFVNVGRPFLWYSRLTWTYQAWQKHLKQANVSTWIGCQKGTPIGYAELEKQGPDVEIAFFGLLPQFIGRGLGGWFLSEVIRAGWSPGAGRIWLHTCTSDHQAALQNYLARGFSIYKKTEILETIPDKDDPVWGTPDYYRSLELEYEKLQGEK